MSVPWEDWETEFYRDVGRRVKTAREAKRMTQDELARRVHLQRTSVTNIERGRQKMLLHTFLAVAEALNTEWRLLMPTHVRAANRDYIMIKPSRGHVTTPEASKET